MSFIFGGGGSGGGSGGPALPLSLANGGDGASNQWTIISTTGEINNLSLTTNCLYFTGLAPDLTGMANDGTEREIFVFYAGSGTLTIRHGSSSSSVGNRFNFPNASSFIGNGAIIPLTAVKFKWNSTQNAWVLASLRPYSFQAPLALTGGFSVSMSVASTTNAGYLTPGNFTSFNNKVDGKGQGGANRLSYWNSTDGITSSSQINVNPNFYRIGVQTSDPKAPFHAISETAETPDAPLTFTATLLQPDALNIPYGSSASQIAGRLMNPDSPSAIEDSSGTSAYAGTETLTYRIYAYDEDGNYSATYTETTPVTLTGTNGVDISWTDDNTGSIAIAGYAILRDVDSGGFVDIFDVGLVTSYNDQGTDFASGSIGTQYDDYIANGTTRNYNAYSQKALGVNYYYSIGAENYTLLDDNSGKPYRVQHTIIGFTNAVRVIGAEDGTSDNSYIDDGDGSFVEISSSWTLGTTTTPDYQSIGYTSNGTVLTKNFAAHKTDLISGTSLYSTSNLTASTTDPNNSQVYYIELSITWANPSTGVKVLRDSDADTNYDDAKISSGGTSIILYDTGNAWGAEFPDNITVTPNSRISECFIGEKEGTDLSYPAQYVARGSDDYARFEIQKDDETRLAAFQANDTEASLVAKNTTPVFRWENGKIAFYNTAPISKPTITGSRGGNAALASLLTQLANLGLITDSTTI